MRLAGRGTSRGPGAVHTGCFLCFLSIPVCHRLAKVNDRSRLMERAQGMLQQDRSLEVLGSPIFLAEFVSLIAEGKLSIPDVRRRGSLEFLIQRTFKRER